MPWGDPTGAILAPLALVGLIYSRKRKKSSFDTFLIVLFVAVSVGMGLAACGPAPVPPTGPSQPPSVPPASPSTPDIPASAQTPVPVAQPSTTATSILDQIFATPCPTPTWMLTPMLTLTPGPMHTSPDGLQHIKDWEGRQLQPYNDGEVEGTDLFYNRTGRGNGHCTVGWGHVIHQGPCDGSPSEDYYLSITPKQADDIFIEDLIKAEVEVNKRIKVQLTQSQYDAIVSLFFNWNLYDVYPDKVNLINAGRYQEAGIHFLLGPITVGGGVKREPGLMRRRYEEAEMFLRGYDIVLPPLDVYMADPYGIYEATLNAYLSSR